MHLYCFQIKILILIYDSAVFLLFTNSVTPWGCQSSLLQKMKIPTLSSENCSQLVLKSVNQPWQGEAKALVISSHHCIMVSTVTLRIRKHESKFQFYNLITAISSNHTAIWSIRCYISKIWMIHENGISEDQMAG